MISLPAAIFWVTYIWNPGGAISPSWADTQWAVNSSDSSHSTESTLSNTKVEEGTTIQTFSSACKFGKCFQYRITERIRMEATTVGHLVPTPCSSKIIPEHMAQACIWMVLEYLSEGDSTPSLGNLSHCTEKSSTFRWNRTQQPLPKLRFEGGNTAPRQAVRWPAQQHHFTRITPLSRKELSCGRYWSAF